MVLRLFQVADPPCKIQEIMPTFENNRKYARHILPQYFSTLFRMRHYFLYFAWSISYLNNQKHLPKIKLDFFHGGPIIQVADRPCKIQEIMPTFENNRKYARHILPQYFSTLFRMRHYFLYFAWSISYLNNQKHLPKIKLDFIHGAPVIQASFLVFCMADQLPK